MSASQFAHEYVNCEACGTRQRTDMITCGRCDYPLTRRCRCGKGVAVFESICPHCGRSRRRATKGKSRFVKIVTDVRLVGAVAILIAAGGAVYWLKFHDPAGPEPWQIKEQAHVFYKEKAYSRAADLYGMLADQDETDAQNWYMLAVCRAENNADPADILPDIEKALELDPRMPKALALMAVTQRKLGAVIAASEYAERALHTGQAPAAVHLLRAELELEKSAPDLKRALAAMQSARAAGLDTAEMKIQIAELHLRLAPTTSQDLLPVEVLKALFDADEALKLIDAEEYGYLRFAVARARLALAGDRPDNAAAALQGVPQRAFSTAAPDLKAEYHLLKARGLFAQEDPAAVSSECQIALEMSPSAATAARIADFLTEHGMTRAAVRLLEGASMDGAAGGGMHGVLAGLLLRLGDVERAANAINAAGLNTGSASKDLQFLLVEGDVRLAQGRVEEARSSYSQAQIKGTGLLEPRLRLALLSLATRGSRDMRNEAVRAQVAELRRLDEEFGKDARLWRTVAQLHLGLAESAEAREMLDIALTLSPGDADSWRAVGDAWLLSDDAVALENAANAYARARIYRSQDSGLVAAETRVRLQMNEPTEALVTCETFLNERKSKRLPLEADIVRLRAECYRRLLQWDAVAQDMKTLLEMPGSDPDALVVEILEAQFRANRSTDAREFARTQRNKATPELRTRIDFTLEYYERGPDDAEKTVSRMGPTVLLAQLQLYRGDVQAALETSREVLRRNPQDVAAARLLALTLLGRPETQPGDIEEARYVADAIGDADPPPGVVELLRGNCALASGDVDLAIRELSVAAQLLPGDPMARFLYGRALFLSGSRTDSLSELLAASLLPTAPLGVRRTTAETLLLASKQAASPRRAELLARESRRLDDQLHAAAVQLASLLYARGEYGDAAELAEETLANPDLTVEVSTALRYGALAARAATGELDRANSHLTDLPLVDDEDPKALAVRGFAYLSVEKTHRAQKAFEKALFIEPSEPLAMLGNIDLALRRRELDTAITTAANWQRDYPKRTDAANAAARLLVERGFVPQAIEIVKRTRRAVPGDLQTARNLVWLLGSTGLGPAAVQEARRFVDDAAAPDRVLARLLHGRAQLRYEGDADAALGVARGLRLDGGQSVATDRRARTLEAEALLALRRVDEAGHMSGKLMKEFDAGAEYFAGDRRLRARVWFVSGSVLAHQGQYKKAAEVLSGCVDLTPEDPMALNNYAWALAHNEGAAERAVEFARKARDLRETDPHLWDTHAHCAAKALDADTAEASWRKALSLYAARPKPEPRARARTALALADLLASKGDKVGAKKVLKDVPTFARGTPEAERALGLLRGGDER